MKKTGILIGVGAVAILAGGYAIAASHYSDHFLPRTTIDGIDVSGLTATQADKKVKENSQKEKLTLSVGNKQWTTIDKAPFIDEKKIDAAVQKQMQSQSGWSWPVALIKPHQYTIKAAIDQQKVKNFRPEIKKAITQYNRDKKDPVNASLLYENDQIVFTKSHNGTKLDVKKATHDIEQALCENQQQIDLQNDVQKPTITRDSPELKQRVDQMEKISKIKAYYDFNGKKVRIPNDEIKSWLMLDLYGNVALNQTKVQAYVNQIADKYNTYKHEVPFKSTKQGTVKLYADVYSWSISTAAEAQGLSEQILQGKDFTRVPITSGSASANGPFVGNTYIEVDLANQHMWYYKDGKLFLDTDIVSGKPTQETPTGFFYVWNKERNAVLKGQDYASPVSYWMPVNWDGVGIHDSDWQTAYGGTRWKDGFGSHGCINTPPAVMAKLYNATAVGTPVVILK